MESYIRNYEADALNRAKALCLYLKRSEKMEIKAYKCEVCGKIYEMQDEYEKCRATHKDKYEDSFVDGDLSVSVWCKKSNISATYELGIEKDGDTIYFDTKEIEILIEELNKRTPQTLAIKFAMDRISGKKVIL